eukprot:7349093-Heterocapsa_arctica.AAC.1
MDAASSARHAWLSRCALARAAPSRISWGSRAMCSGVRGCARPRWASARSSWPATASAGGATVLVFQTGNSAPGG